MNIYDCVSAPELDDVQAGSQDERITRVAKEYKAIRPRHTARAGSGQLQSFPNGGVSLVGDSVFCANLCGSPIL